MEGDHYEVLSETTRIAGEFAADPPRSIKEVLRFLAGALSFDEISLSFFDSRLKIVTRTISSAGPELFLPATGHQVAALPAGAARKLWGDELAGGELRLPVGADRHPCGILILRPASPAPLSEETRRLLRTVCHQLASLAQAVLGSDNERRQMQRLSLLSELGQALNRAGTVRSVLQAAIRTLRRHTDVACIILRPLLGGTVLGRSQVWTTPAWKPLRVTFLELEEEQSRRALAGKTLLFHQGIGRRSAELSPLPQAMVTAPLLFQNRPMGSLTVFGDHRQEALSFRADRESKRFFVAIGCQIGHALERVTALERLGELSAENDRKLREATLLFHIARAMHSTLRLNELMHLILSAATVSGGGGFERAILFMLNERSGIFQGMLCVTRETASLVLPSEAGTLAWERPVVNTQAQEVQRQHPSCRQVMQLRLPLKEDNALARAITRRRVVFVSRPDSEPPAAAAFAQSQKLAPYACAPLYGRDRPLGVLVVDNPESREEISPDRLRFLELFANLAGAAMENSMLLNRLETAHQDLRETQERLIQGEKMAVLGEMAASVTHELRNPLVAIGGFAQRLNRVAAGAREKEYATIIAREVQRMEAMLSNILDFAKKEMLCFAECPVPQVIEEALALEYDALLRGSVRLVTEIAESLPTIQGDEQKLRQVMINLIANARQAMSAGGVLTVRAYRTILRGDEAVTVEVEDTGGGIPADILRNIFNPFFTTKEGGTGLGLPISHRIVEQHRGRIEVKNRVRGAVFILRLPVRGSDAPFR
ncbi:MAG TPA: ATP-binding protein [Desulfuromonadales bacterium]|nr:ATP-binding protein [Desulfuromonadales bacterium]